MYVVKLRSTESFHQILQFILDLERVLIEFSHSLQMTTARRAHADVLSGENTLIQLKCRNSNCVSIFCYVKNEIPIHFILVLIFKKNMLTLSCIFFI